jgi:hypothetical protein
LLGGVPDDWTKDNLADNLIALQEQAEKAASYEKKFGEYEAQLAATTAAAAAAAKIEPKPPVVDEDEMPWGKPVHVDPTFHALVQADPDGGFKPRNAGNPVHVAAAQEMNRRAQYERQFVSNLLDDPEGVVSKLTQRQLAAMKKELTEKLDAIQSQFQPMQDTLKETKTERQMSQFLAAHSQELYSDDKLTPLGEVVDALLETGAFDSPEKALERAKKMSGISLSKPGKTQELPKPQSERLVDAVTNRFKKQGQGPPNRAAFDGGSGKWKTSWDDVMQRSAAYSDE